MRSGYRVELIFSFTLPKGELGLLKLIQSYFSGVGIIGKHGKDRISYIVSTSENLNTILTHFDNYPPLSTQLRKRYELFKRAVDLVNRKQHLTVDGLQEIVNLKSAINLGLSQGLISAFPATVSSSKIVVKNPEIPDPN